MENLQHIAKH